MMSRFKLLVLFLLFSSMAVAMPEHHEKLKGTGLLASQVVEGSASLFTNKEIRVTAVKKSGSTTYITLKTMDQRATATLAIPTLSTQQLPLVAGQVLKVTSNAGTYLLYAAGQLVAVLPHEFNKTLTLKTHA
ncbi:hypothetical protein GH742_13530 [Legionella sp. MW5194]|uniref:hypothetical protein n=1 Tax=Legionella sp. MW5194 TaxID=2662448 RepID=UPI00193CF344|nr:hypothetical protein [Legionella sp. MW5194]QRN04797.1 hypothetical protein GH742_13530 [Legionella sp. MW5194]